MLRLFHWGTVVHVWVEKRLLIGVPVVTGTCAPEVTDENVLLPVLLFPGLLVQTRAALTLPVPLNTQSADARCVNTASDPLTAAVVRTAK